MNAAEYQRAAARTLIDDPPTFPAAEIMIVWNALGLAGEAGEVAELVKKGVFHKHGLDREALAKELGDVLWYVAALASKLDLDLGDIMTANIAKLQERYPDGYSSADSQARRDAAPAPPSLGGWVLVTERLPEPGVWVLVWAREDAAHRIARYNAGVWVEQSSYAYVDSVTHWQPLPVPPEETP